MFVAGDNKFLRGSLWSCVGTKQCLQVVSITGLRMRMYFFSILVDVFFLYTREALRFFP